jgi:transposase-like protein
MRRVREMLRLSRGAGLGVREVARRTGIAPSTLREMLRRFERSGLDWPLPLDLSDTDLEARLYGEAGIKQGHRRRPEPDWAALNRELKRKHVTLQILWDEYIEAYPDGYRYSRFCELYRAWEARLPVTMRQTVQRRGKRARRATTCRCSPASSSCGRSSPPGARPGQAQDGGRYDPGVPSGVPMASEHPCQSALRISAGRIAPPRSESVAPGQPDGQACPLSVSPPAVADIDCEYAPISIRSSGRRSKCKQAEP